MRRGGAFLVALLVALLVLVAAAGAGVGAWLLARDSGLRQPQVSAYSNGHLVRVVEPYLYCDVLDLNKCRLQQSQGELAVNSRDPVQLSVDTAISRAPWRLLQVYQDSFDIGHVFGPNTTSAVTVPVVDPQRGPLLALVVQLLTLVVDSAGELHAVPHAEWAVRIIWD